MKRPVTSAGKETLDRRSSLVARGSINLRASAFIPRQARDGVCGSLFFFVARKKSSADAGESLRQTFGKHRRWRGVNQRGFKQLSLSHSNSPVLNLKLYTISSERRIPSREILYFSKKFTISQLSIKDKFL
jgi:hypothetical protein